MEPRYKKYNLSRELLDKYIASNVLSPGEKKKIDYLLQGSTLENSCEDFISNFQRDLDRLGEERRLAIFDAGGGRGSSFRRKQGQGAWAEEIILSIAPDRLAHYGPSSGMPPEDTDYGDWRRRCREIEVLDGKRPDLLLFKKGALEKHRDYIAEWPRRPLYPRDDAARSDILAGIEIKSSAISVKAYNQRSKKTDNRELSITIKLEEIEPFGRWSEKYGVPIILIQVFADSIYFCNMDAAIRYNDPNMRRTRSYGDKHGVKKPTLFIPINNPGVMLTSIQGIEDYFDYSENGSVIARRGWPKVTLDAIDIESLLI